MWLHPCTVLGRKMNLDHKSLCEVAERWLGKNKKQNLFFPKYPIHVREMVCLNVSEIPDAIGFNYYGSCIIEVKVTHADFIADQKKPFRQNGDGMGNYRYYLCPENLINEDELPKGWGLIYVSKSGRTKEIKKSDFFDLTKNGYINEKCYLFSICSRIKKGI